MPRQRWNSSVWIAFFAFLTALCLMLWGVLGSTQPAFSQTAPTRWCAKFRGDYGNNINDTKTRMMQAQSVSMDDLTRLMADINLCGGSF